MSEKIELNQIYETCKNHMHSYVLIETTDGKKHDGIITGLDDRNVYLAAPLETSEDEDRQYNYGSFGRPPYGGSYYGGSSYYGATPYGGYFPPRRFRRLVLPLAALAVLSLLPWY